MSWEWVWEIILLWIIIYNKFNKLTWIDETYWLDDYELKYNTNENDCYN